MSIRNKPLTAISAEDLQALVDLPLFEDKHTEYKQSLPDKRNEEDKREFLADVSAFANSAGGDLLFGIEAEDKEGPEKGRPKKLCGLQGISPDQAKLRASEMLQMGVNPRIPGISMATVDLAQGGFVLVIRVLQSWTGPHMVTYNKHDKIYGRGPGHKYTLDISELRTAFGRSATSASQIEEFRFQRLARITSDEAPVSLPQTPKMILHLIPRAAFEPDAGTAFSIEELRDNKPSLFFPSSGWNHRVNFDGLLLYNDRRQATVYAQIYRNGILEAVDSDISFDNKGVLSIYASIETYLMDGIKAGLDFQKRLNIAPPVLVLCTLIGVRGAITAVPSPRFSSGVAIDRDMLVIPDVVLESWDDEPDEIIRPLCDAIWNAAGYDVSPNFDAKGKLKRQ